MFVPFLTRRKRSIARRAGDGGGDAGGDSGGDSGGGDSGSSGGGSSSAHDSSGGDSDSSEGAGSGSAGKGTSGGTISAGGSSTSIFTGGSGGGKNVTIPSGQTFAGRHAGGATRDQIYGSKTFGSGYTGYNTRGINGRGFPFWFWPLSWGSDPGHGVNAAYLYTNEYGDPNNSSRPGGPIVMAAFQSKSNATTFRLVADNQTVVDLIPVITSGCSHNFSSNSTTPTAFSAIDAAPEQVVQYYRASSLALTLDGYNNSAAFGPEGSAADTSLPAGIDDGLLGCLNNTIGQSLVRIPPQRAHPIREFDESCVDGNHSGEPRHPPNPCPSFARRGPTIRVPSPPSGSTSHSEIYLIAEDSAAIKFPYRARTLRRKVKSAVNQHP
ncbi:hypothetical protein R3P38DRAFT_1590134 [Favolaschia claudopus]|uniref:Uncharacterized protein n=1 Tax=Favolaschia claudopus TaxID=2862362 RepID=A0AAW0AHT2_9AGAR